MCEGDRKRKEEAVSTNTAAGWKNSVGGLPTTAAAVLMLDLNEVAVVGGRSWGGGEVGGACFKK